MADAAGRISKLQIFCPCGKSFENTDSYLEHKQLCAIHQEGRKIISMTPSSNLSAATVPARASIPAPTPKEILRPCGQSFTTKKTQEKHLRYSKTHQAGKNRTGCSPNGKLPVSVPAMAAYSSPTTISPALGLVPDTISFSVAAIIPYTCGKASETQPLLDLHERDSLYHRRQADKSLTQNQEENNFLVSSFASLNLASVSTRARPSVARFICVCGEAFTCQKDLAKHEQEKRRLVWPEKGQRRENMFKTPRPQYQPDEDLRNLAAILARQCYEGE
jgi:hypothetical protein